MPHRSALLLMVLTLAAPALAASLTPLPCVLDIDCGDADACTTDVCDHGVCRHEAVAGCQACEIDADCSDGDPCSSDTCTDGACDSQPDPSCTPCTEAADCADDDPCTTGVCEETGICTRARTPGCGVPDPVERCGNCIDDDGDGLVDWEDDACCGSVVPLELARLGARAGLLRLTTRQPLPRAAADMTLQLIGIDGIAQCLTIDAATWVSGRRGMLRVDRAGVVQTARLDPARGRFRTTLHGAVLAPGPLRVALRVGDACARGGAVLRPRRRLLVAP